LPGIGVIFNPFSGGNQRDPGAAARLSRVLGSHGSVREARSIEELHGIAQEFRDRDIDVLAISGGDGTSGVTVSGFVAVYGAKPLPPIAVLRGGTMNTIASSIGVRRGHPERLLEQLVRAYQAREVAPLREVERDTLCVCTRDARASVSAHPHMPALSTKYGFLFGAGVVCGFLAEYYATGRTPALAGVTLLRAAGSTLVGGPMIRRIAAPFRGSVLVDGSTLWEEGDYLAIAGGTIEQIGLGFKPFYRASDRPGRFHLLGIYTSPLRFLRQLGRVREGRAMQPGHCHDVLANHASVRAARYPLVYMVDGDLYESESPLDVSIGPRVRLIVVDEGAS
jgi:diacylglycerol kinase family enzyme